MASRLLPNRLFVETIEMPAGDYNSPHVWTDPFETNGRTRLIMDAILVAGSQIPSGAIAMEVSEDGLLWKQNNVDPTKNVWPLARLRLMPFRSESVDSSQDYTVLVAVSGVDA